MPPVHDLMPFDEKMTGSTRKIHNKLARSIKVTWRLQSCSKALAPTARAQEQGTCVEVAGRLAGRCVGHEEN